MKLKGKTFIFPIKTLRQVSSQFNTNIFDKPFKTMWRGRDEKSRRVFYLFTFTDS